MTLRRLAIALAVVVFLATSALVARWLQADSIERAKVERLLAAQVRNDSSAMAREIDDCTSSCRRELAVTAARMQPLDGELEVVRYDSATSHALSTRTGPTRVVWRVAGPAGTLPTVQCVTVRRTGGPLTGPRVTLLRLSAPIGREAGC